MVVVVYTVALAHTELAFVHLEYREVDTEPWTVPEQHSLITTRKSFYSFFSVDPSDFFGVRHLFRFLFLSSDFQEVKDERHIRVTKAGEEARQEILEVKRQTLVFVRLTHCVALTSEKNRGDWCPRDYWTHQTFEKATSLQVSQCFVWYLRPPVHKCL